MKSCADCGWLIIKDTTGKWGLFLTVAPIAVGEKPDPHLYKCEKTGKEHRVGVG